MSPSLFSADKIPHVPLPEGYTLRPLARTDYSKGFLDVLRGLTSVGDISQEAWEERYDFMASRAGEYFVICVEDGAGRIVGVGSVIVEFKFLRNLGKVGHIEDIAVLEDQRGKNLGKSIIAALDEIAKGAGCYKTILDCSEKNEGFYVKCGHKKAGVQMSNYF